MLKNWMPTIGGLLAAIGGVLATNSNPTLAIVGQILTAIGLVLLGSTAKQYNVTGGSKPQTEEAKNRSNSPEVK